MKCLFVQVDSCRHPIQPLSVGTETRMSSIIDASKIRNDGLHLTIEHNCSSAGHYHKNCVSTCTSKCHMKRLSHTIARSNSPQPKRQCRSDLRNFDFNTQCLFCGDLCKPDTNHPSRHLKRIVLCKTADRPQRKSFKATIVDNCHARGDQWSNEGLEWKEQSVICMRPMPGITMTVRQLSWHLDQCNLQKQVLQEINHQSRVIQLMTNWYVRCRQSDQE